MTGRKEISILLSQRSNRMACASLGEVVLLMDLPADSPAGPAGPAAGPTSPAEEGQHLPDGRMATPTSTFTQQDIDDGIVWYRHSGALTQSDAFHFQVPSVYILTILRPPGPFSLTDHLGEGGIISSIKSFVKCVYSGEK